MFKKFLKLLLFVAVFAAIGAGGAYLFFGKTDSLKTGKAPSPAEKRITEEEEHSLFPMPSFEDQLLNEAKLTLENLDIKLGKVTWVHSDSVDKGKVIAQRPLPGSIRGKEVNFLVSLGPYDVIYRCPSFINMKIEDARILSENLGIKLVEQNEGTKVASQTPEEGTIIRKGDSVEVTLGSGRWMWF
ncbi:MAG: PASTA domain-containing protein [Nitrospiraceae bacterium]|nr:MAG: PASTA domain-containing protein [Nitrospiraceae bacterium]